MRLVLLVAVIISVTSLASTDIQADLRDFYDILPKFRLSMVAAKHYFFDRSFRTGVKFLQSNEFKALVREDLAESPEVQNIVAYLDYPVSVNFIENGFRSVNMDGEPEIMPRSLASFANEVIELVPVGEVKELIKQKVSSSDEFRRFYERVSDPEFKRLVYLARDSERLENTIRKLENNEVNVDRILNLIFAVLEKVRVN